MKPTQADIDKAKSATDRDLFQIDLGDHAVLVAAPTYQQWRRFMKERMDDAKKSVALITLAQDCLMWPSRQDWVLLLDKKPLLGEAVGGKIVELSGADVEPQAKKL